ncbi:hypothetical protein SAMN04487905_1284 [Actinopolyspora xinjiangensis]|uniref:Uncharacterized protein n=1 Tax=Actinopolyspora xinjiangensis TaxID=405564 RepID=A0A1H0X4M5_9ACTN|nr:hypothetical protein [Actinopolyspora xinjiangensis]SDP97436.1 hypothetical protein SAMN04487905_1284 [Actinopolyspora xinjiangensis]
MIFRVSEKKQYERSVFESKKGGAVSLLAVGATGALTGIFAAFSFYYHILNPFAHALTLWVLLSLVVSARLHLREAVLRSTIGLFFAVIAFYFCKALFYNTIYYPAAPAISVQVGNMFMWCLLAVFAGGVLGVLFSGIGSASWAGAASAAAAIALLLASTLEETRLSLGNDALLLWGFCVCSIIVVIFFVERTKAQIKRIILMVPPFLVAGLIVVVSPDVIQQFLI